MRNRYFFALDILLLPVAVYLSFVLRLESLNALPAYLTGIALMSALSVLIVPLIFWKLGIYSRYWRYASVEEMLLLVGAVTASVILVGALSMGALYALGDRPVASFIPRSVPLIYLLLALVVTASPRMAVRVLAGYSPRRLLSSVMGDYNRTDKARGRRGLHASLPARVPVAIMGAGDAGAIIVRELQKNPSLGMDPIGFLDDDLGKHDVRIHNVPVLGDRNAIPRIIRDYKVQQVIIAMPKAPGKTIREIVRVCEQNGVQTKLMPGIYELLGGTVSVNQLRNVEIEDLLRRDPVETDVAAVSQLIRGRRVLVTGGGGSIGSELCRQALQFGPAELTLIGHGENSIFETQNELLKRSSQSSSHTKVHAVIADIRFPERIHAVLRERRPDIIFHAAAHKHVPLMELNPPEAITNNVIGTRHLLNSAIENGVECFVMISTDKAVNPSSVMGASKRVAELLVHQAAHDDGSRRSPSYPLNGKGEYRVDGLPTSESPCRRYCAVRFGNVLGSRGSVVLIFKQQIAAGGPITITDPEMKRYFMTIPEAVQLVLQASVLGKGGEVFVLDMGEPIKIIDLARDLVELSGLEVGRDIDIVCTGARPGEKLFEELFLPNEVYQRTRHDKIFIAGNASSFIPPNLDQAVAALEAAAYRNDDDAIVHILRNLIPEFQPQVL
jgi:FlaA1/EpsC-like NDP-sugar epimerase